MELSCDHRQRMATAKTDKDAGFLTIKLFRLNCFRCGALIETDEALVHLHRVFCKDCAFHQAQSVSIFFSTSSIQIPHPPLPRFFHPHPPPHFPFSHPTLLKACCCTRWKAVRASPVCTAVALLRKTSCFAQSIGIGGSVPRASSESFFHHY